MARTRILLASLTALAALALAPAALAAPSIPDLDPASDSGESTTDNITNDPTPTFQITGATGGALVTLCIIDSNTTGTPASFGTAPGGSSVSITAVTPLTDGTYKVTAHVDSVETCATGSGETSDGYLFLVVDTVAPTLTTPPQLVTFAGADPETTYSATPQIAVAAEAGSTVTLYEGATVRGSAKAVGSLALVTVTPALSDGAHTLAAKATDLAGNTSTLSPTLDLTVDATPPAVSAPDLIDDDGASSNDNFTSNPRPRFTVATESGAVVTIFENGIALGSAVSSGGVATVQVREALWLDPGAHCVYAIGVDAVGNPSAATSELCITIAPGVPPFTSNLGVELTGEYIALSLRSSMAATARVRVLHKGKVVAKTQRKVTAGKRTKVGLRLAPKARKARKLVVVVTLTSADGRRLHVRRVVRR